MNIRILHVFFIITMFWSTSVLAANQDVTIYVDENYPPYTFQKNGKANGIYVKILEKAFANMKGYSIEIQAVPWQRGKLLLETGKGFALVPPYFHGHDWPYIWPYSLPILNETVVVMCTDKVLKTPRSNWPEDYAGLTIGINAGYDGYGGDKFWEMVKNGKILLSEATSTRQNIRMLTRQRTDCYMISRLSFAWELKQLATAGLYDASKHPQIREGAILQVDPGYMGFTNADNGAFDFKLDFVKQFDIEIYKMFKNGEIQRIIDDFTK